MKMVVDLDTQQKFPAKTDAEFACMMMYLWLLWRISIFCLILEIIIEKRESAK